MKNILVVIFQGYNIYIATQMCSTLQTSIWWPRVVWIKEKVKKLLGDGTNEQTSVIAYKTIFPVIIIFFI